MSDLDVSVGGKLFEIEVENLSYPDHGLAVFVNGKRVKVYIPENRIKGDESDWIIVENRPYEILIDPDYHWIKTDCGFYSLEIHDRQSNALLPCSSDGRLKAPIPGLVTQVLVEVGDLVEAGQPLLVLEAMKMENEIRAPRAGKVRVVSATSGQGVKLNDVLVEID